MDDGTIGTVRTDVRATNAIGTGSGEALPAQVADHPSGGELLSEFWAGIRADNGCIGCAPAGSLSIQKRDGEKKFIYAKQQNELLELQVIFGGEGGHTYSPGDLVWVEHADTTREYLKREFEISGKKFILVPITAIRLHRRS
jgi:hypothetical protein